MGHWIAENEVSPISIPLVVDMILETKVFLALHVAKLVFCARDNLLLTKLFTFYHNNQNYKIWYQIQNKTLSTYT